MTHVARNANYQGSLTTPVPCYNCYKLHIFATWMMNICHLILFSIGPYHTHQPYLPATKKTRNPMFLALNFISGWVYRPSTQCGDLQYLPSLPGVVPSLINFCDHAINNATGYCHVERDLIIFVMSLMSVCFSKRASTKK